MLVWLRKPPIASVPLSPRGAVYELRTQPPDPAPGGTREPVPTVRGTDASCVTQPPRVCRTGDQAKSYLTRVGDRGASCFVLPLRTL